MERCIIDIFARWGTNGRNIKLDLVMNGIAYASGTNILGSLSGSILVNPSIINFFSYEEIRFILAHECAHILENHSLANAIYEGIENAASNLLKIPNAKDLAKIVSSVINKLVTGNFRDIRGEIIVNNELQADKRAVYYVGNTIHAINSIRKLCRNNLDTYTHFWDLRGVPIGALSARERINNLVILGF